MGLTLIFKMQNEETTNEGEVELQDTRTEVVEETTAEETETESQSETVEETPEAKLAKATAEAAKYRRLFEKSQKPKASVTQKATQTASPNVEETVLLAQGMPEELLAELKAVAAVRRVSLIKAQTDPIFIAVKEKFEKEKKQASASLGASRGSGSVKAKKSFDTPGLSREEHKAMVQGL
jgi:hypothetical protein